jgi:hypothetical protein
MRGLPTVLILAAAAGPASACDPPAAAAVTVRAAYPAVPVRTAVYAYAPAAVYVRPPAVFTATYAPYPYQTARGFVPSRPVRSVLHRAGLFR